MINPTYCLVLDDSRKGHLNQVLSVFYFRPEWKKKIVLIEYKNNICRFIANLLAVFRISNPFILRALLKNFPYQQLEVIDWKYVMSAGSISAPINFMLSRCFKSKSILFLKSTLTSFNVPYDLNIIPFHDKKKNNPRQFVMYLAPNHVTKDSCDKEKVYRQKNITYSQKKKIAFIVGGPSKNFVYDELWFYQTIQFIKKFVDENQWALIGTSSRRTPIALAETMESELVWEDLVLAHEQDENPIPAFLALSDHILVSEDSFNMVSECIASGKPVTVIEVPKKSHEYKFQKTYQYFKDNGWANFWNVSGNIELSSLILNFTNRCRPDDEMNQMIQAIENMK